MARGTPAFHPALVFSVDDNYRDQPGLRRGGLAAHRPPFLEPWRVSGPADDAWIVCRDPASVTGAFGSIVRPVDCQQLDCGVALAIVVGRSAFRVAVERARDHIAGVTVALDVVRAEIPASQAYLARSYPTHTPLGPKLVADVDPDSELELSLYVNGAQRQSSSTAQMIASPAALLSAITRRVPLAAGDVILTGTPGGVARDSGDGWLAPGDVVTAEIERVGRMELTVVEEYQP